MKETGTKIIVTHLNEPVFNQAMYALMLRPWQFFSRRMFLTLMGIRHFEAQGAFDEPGTYYITACQYGGYRLFKRNPCNCDLEETT